MYLYKRSLNIYVHVEGEPGNNSTIHDIISIRIITTGAGKTTTFNMLTGDISPTSGTAIIYGYDIRTNLRKVTDVHCILCHTFQRNMYYVALFLLVKLEMTIVSTFYHCV